MLNVLVPVLGSLLGAVIGTLSSLFIVFLGIRFVAPSGKTPLRFYLIVLPAAVLGAFLTAPAASAGVSWLAGAQSTAGGLTLAVVVQALALGFIFKRVRDDAKVSSTPIQSTGCDRNS